MEQSTPYRLQQPLMLADPSSDTALLTSHQQRPFYRSPHFLLAAVLGTVALVAMVALIGTRSNRSTAGPALPPDSFTSLSSSFASPASPTSPPLALSSPFPQPPTAAPSATSTTPLAPSSTPSAFSSSSPLSPPSLTSSAHLAPPPHLPLSSVASYSHASSCFTQGLAFYKGALYESCGNYGSSQVRQVNLTTGAAIRSAGIDRRYFAEGLTVLNDLVYVLTWREREVLVYSLDLVLQSTLSIDTDGWGLTHNGSALIVSDGTSSLYYRDPATMRLLRRVQVTQTTSPTSPPQPLGNLNELEWVKGRVLANVWMTTDVAVIGDDGTVEEVLDGAAQASAAGGDNWNRVMNGVAWRVDTQQMYVTGKYWPLLFEVTGH